MNLTYELLMNRIRQSLCTSLYVIGCVKVAPFVMKMSYNITYENDKKI